MDRGAWRATVNSIANNQTRLKLKRLSTLDLRGIWKLSFTSFIYLTKVLNVLSTEIQKESIKSISSLLDKVKKKKVHANGHKNKSNSEHGSVLR